VNAVQQEPGSVGGPGDSLLSQDFSLFRRGYQELLCGIRRKISSTLGNGVLSVGKHVRFYTVLTQKVEEGAGCNETAVIIYQSTRRNILKEHRCKNFISGTVTDSCLSDVHDISV
jgi:hypothetical protein